MSARAAIVDRVVADMAAICPAAWYKPLGPEGFEGPFGVEESAYPGPGSLHVWTDGLGEWTDDFGEPWWESYTLFWAWAETYCEPYRGDPYGRLHPALDALTWAHEGGDDHNTAGFRAFAAGLAHRYGKTAAARRAFFEVGRAICVRHEPQPPAALRKMGAVRPERPEVGPPDLFGGHTPRDARRLAAWEERAAPWLAHDAALDDWRAKVRSEVDWPLRRRVREACGFTWADDLAVDVGLAVSKDG